MENKSIYGLVFASELKKSDHARIAICKGTFELIAQEGIRNLSFQKIGDSCAMKKAQVKYYFNSIGDILHCMLKYTYLNAQEITIQTLKTLQSESSQSRLLASVRGAFAWAEDYPEEVHFTLLFGSLGIYEEDMQKLIGEIRATGLKRIQMLLLQNFKLGPSSAKKIAHEIQMSIQGALYDWAILKRYTLGTYEQRTTAAISRLLQDLSPKTE